MDEGSGARANVCINANIFHRDRGPEQPGHHNAIVVIILPGLLSRYRLVLTLTQTCTRCLTMFDNYCYEKTLLS